MAVSLANLPLANLPLKINPVKLILGIMVVVYDILFVIQHYCLYPERSHGEKVDQVDSPQESKQEM